MEDYYRHGRHGILDGIISKGTVVQVRLSSSRIILNTTTENDMRCSSLVSRIAQQCAAEEDVPIHCMRLCWEPPSTLCMADESAGPALPGTMKPLSMAATAVIIALQEEDHERPCDTLDYCLVCLDPVGRGDRDENCVRCTPCSLCEKCVVTVEGKSVCLQCIECYEENLLDAQAFRRKLLV